MSSQSNNNITKLSYHDLTDDQKKKIKDLGRQTYKNLTSSFSIEAFNEFFKINNINLEYGTPTKEYLETNIEDINWAISNLTLDYSTSKKLKEELSSLEEQLRSDSSGKKGKYVVFFQEKNGDIKEWSIVNLFDNNILFWVYHINRFLNGREIKKNQIDKLIDRYFSEPFEGEPNGLAQDDLIISIGSVNSYKNIVSKTWESGNEVENNFVNFLSKNKFSKSDIRVFSGKKNVIDGIGIDLAIRCNGQWYPIQVKSHNITDNRQVPKNGFGAYPQNDSFTLINKKGIQVSLSEICGLGQKTNIPSSIDYFGSMGITKPEP